MRIAVFAASTTAIGIATGVLVALLFGQLMGVSWGLAILTGVEAGVLALGISISLSDPRFAHVREGVLAHAMSNRRRPRVWRLRHAGVWVLAWSGIAPMFFVDSIITNPLALGSTVSRSASCSGSPEASLTCSVASEPR